MATRQTSIGARALHFLHAHQLEETPEHYAFAHRYISGRDREFNDAVDHHIEGGVRLREEALRALTPASLGSAGGQTFDYLATQLLDLLRQTVSVTGTFNRDLVQTAAALTSAEPERVREMVLFMIERTAKAEASLSATLRQAQALRDTLNGAREDVGRDPLTGLPGYKAMMERLEASVSGTDDCAAAIVDVDQLAALIVEHGKGMGDRVLKAVAMTLQEACAPYQVGRWGEVSFLVLLDHPGIEIGTAALTAACADMATRRLKLRENNEPLGRVTLSAGIATSRGRDARLVARAAEKCRTDATRQGGNRVVAEQS